MLVEGIITGLGAAFFQSLSYLGTRHYVQKRRASAGPQLLVLGHAMMGVFALVMLPFFWPAAAIRWRETGIYLLFNTLAYVSGQLGLVVALRQAEASRVSPLMTFKLMVSSILVMMYGQPVGAAEGYLTHLQWIAVALCVIAGVSINFSGGRMKALAIAAVAWASVSFSVSDWNINLMIKSVWAVPGMDQFHASMICGLLSYLATGVIALVLLPFLGSRRRRDWRDAAPFSLSWFIAMVCLYMTFASVGILLGTILQCTRGFITIALAFALMQMGQHHIEPPATRGVILRRFAAGVLMFIGISLYVIRDPAKIKMHTAGPTPWHEAPLCHLSPPTAGIAFSPLASCAKLPDAVFCRIPSLSGLPAVWMHPAT